jgi:hypothetical protein
VCALSRDRETEVGRKERKPEGNGSDNTAISSLEKDFLLVPEKALKQKTVELSPSKFLTLARNSFFMLICRSVYMGHGCVSGF